jgi:uncharacterized protein (TIGR03435 family)
MILKMASKTKFSVSRKTMGEFAELLSAELGGSVVDATRLSGLYDITLYYSSENLQAHPRRLERDGVDANDPGGLSLRDAVRQQFGLLFTPGEAPVSFLVMDKIDKTPSGN